jgi:FMN phosphatase YigB (HAD superfamily)
MSTLPKVIFIDWYKTLSTSLFWVDHANALLSSEELHSITRYLFSQPELITQWMKGFLVSEHIAAEVAQVLRLDARNVQNELQYSCEAMTLYDPTVIASIQKLRKQGIKIILATDNMDTFERWTVPALKLNAMFDGIITSVSRGALKSEIVDGYSPFFGHYLGQNGIAASEAVLIDDIPIEEAISSLGMAFRHVTNPSVISTILDEFIQQPLA